MNEIIYLHERNVKPLNFKTCPNSEIWYLDNGASNHMSGDRDFFISIDESVTGKVRFGDDSRINIQGRGSVSVIGHN